MKINCKKLKALILDDIENVNRALPDRFLSVEYVIGAVDDIQVQIRVTRYHANKIEAHDNLFCVDFK